MFLAGMFAISGAFVSCDDSDDTDGVNKLEVTPSTDISFKADGNEDVVLTVVTDDSAPESVVEIEIDDLLIFAENRLNNAGNAVR